MRSSLLGDAVGAFLDHIGERAFDEPLLAMLRAEGFEHVRLTHGTTEFGKDVIAQRDGEQWAWQSKAGNVAQNFRDMAGQLDELRLSNIAHPDFDLTLPRRAVLVTTGRLKGNGIISMREYNERAAARGEIKLEHWDRDILMGKLTGNPDAIMRGSVEAQLLGLLGAIDTGDVAMEDLGTFSQRWESWEPDRLAGLGIVECALLCDRLDASERLDLACHLALCALRAAKAATFAEEDEPQAVVAAREIFDQHARMLWERCDDSLLDELAFAQYRGAGEWIAYPVRCIRLAEIVALLALRTSDVEPELATDIAKWLSRFIAAQPGATRPVGDQYAVSLVPLALALHSQGQADAAARLLERATVWLCDRYEPDALGLAGHHAEPREEVERIFGSAFESVTLTRRRSSHIAAAILDLCAILGYDSLYADAHNDVRAVNAYPMVLSGVHGVDRYLRAGHSNRWDHNPDYADELGDNPVAPHLDIAGVAPGLSQRDAWDLLAVSAALRDRHFTDAIVTLAREAGSSQTVRRPPGSEDA